MYLNLQYPIQKETQTEVDTNIDFQTAGDFSRECNKKIYQSFVKLSLFNHIIIPQETRAWRVINPQSLPGDLYH